MYIPHVPPYHTLLPILPYTILPSRLYPKSIPSYPPHTFNTPRFPSIYILFHSTLSIPYHNLNYFTLPLLKLDRNDSWQKQFVLLGQIDLPSGDKADTIRRKWLMAEDLPTFRHQVILVIRDFCPRPGALWGAVLLFISYVQISKLHLRISIIHFWISIIHFWISKNECRISQNNYGYPKIFGYPKMYFRISTNRFLDIHNSFLDTQKYIKIHFWISKKSCWILDIHNSIFGYPKISVF